VRYLDLDDMESNARARVTEFQREWATNYFGELFDMQAGLTWKAVPPEMKAQMQANDPVKFRKVDRNFGGGK